MDEDIEYDPIDDVWKSTYEAYQMIREKVANGGHSKWLPDSSLTTVIVSKKPPNSIA